MGIAGRRWCSPINGMRGNKASITTLMTPVARWIPMKKYKIAVLDDYQNAALESADWPVLRDRADIAVFQEHLADPDAVIERLVPFDVVCVMRERPPPAPQGHVLHVFTRRSCSINKPKAYTRSWTAELHPEFESGNGADRLVCNGTKEIWGTLPVNRVGK